MATHTLVQATDAKRLEVLKALCSKLAMSAASARDVLRGNPECPDTAEVIADALERIGWIADRAAAVAGETIPVAGDGDGWFLGGMLREQLDSGSKN
jgi:hypothetical protein